MASDSALELTIDAPGNIIEIEVRQMEVDVPRSVGYFGGLAAAVGIASTTRAGADGSSRSDSGPGHHTPLGRHTALRPRLRNVKTQWR